MQTLAEAPLDTCAIDALIARANTNGALQSIETEQVFIDDGGVRFLVRWLSSMTSKDAARVAAAGRRGPGYNPFLPPDPELLLGTLGPTHCVLLNKYPVISRHLLLVTRSFEDQSAPLSAADFDALANVINALGGMGFYNGGAEAGASQPHKHLQWIPDDAEGPNLARFHPELARYEAAFSLTRHPAMPWRHAFVRVGSGTEILEGDTLRTAFALACKALDLSPLDDPMPPYNLLADRQWLLLVPRRCERHREISVNSLGFGGSLFVRRPEQIDIVREIGPLRLLTEVAQPA